MARGPATVELFGVDVPEVHGVKQTSYIYNFTLNVYIYIHMIILSYNYMYVVTST